MAIAPIQGNPTSAPPNPLLVNAPFTSDQAAPMPSPYTAAIGTLNFVQTNGTFGVSAGQLQYNSSASPSWGGQAFYTSSFARTDGLAVCAVVNNQIDKANGTILGWDATPTSNNPYSTARAWAWNIDGTLHVQDGGTSFNTGIIMPYQPNTEWQVAVVMHALGDMWCYRRPNDEAWTIAWVSDPGNTTSPMAGRFVNLAGQGYVRQFQVVQAPNLSGATGAAVSTKTNPASGTVVNGAYTGWTIVEWTPSAADTLTLNINQKENGTAQNALQFRFTEGTSPGFSYGTLVNGTYTQLGTGNSPTYSTGTTYIIKIQRVGTRVSMWQSGTYNVVSSDYLDGYEGGSYTSLTYGSSTVTSLTTLPIGLTISGAYGDGNNRRIANYSALNAAAYQTIPTNPPSNNVPTSTDTTGQSVEPCVMYFPNGWGSDSNSASWNYWMAVSPFPGAVDTYENPSIYVSNDGASWEVPPGLVNVASTTLSSALVSGTAYTSLSVATLTGMIYSGETITIGTGGTTQTVTASASALPGATTISVTSFTANAAYASGTAVSSTQTGNPIVWNEGGGSFNSDQSIVIDASNKMWLFDRTANQTANTDQIQVYSSTDGVTWTAGPVILTGTYGSLSAPMCVYDGESNQYVLFTTVQAQSMSRHTANAVDGTWSSAQPCVINYGLGFSTETPNEGNIHIFNGVYYCIMSSGSNIENALMASYDKGLTWNCESMVITPGASGNWDGHQVYRGSLVPTSTGWDYWYGGINANNQWYVGKTTVAAQ